jgi:hypothetical protein
VKSERHPLLGAQIKINRASKHITDFQKFSIEFFKSYSAQEHEDETTLWNYPGGEELYSTAGDAIHNMRSALDHVAYAVALKNGLSEERALKRVSFTISPTENDFNDAIKSKKTSDIGDEWVKFLRRVQPYQPGNDTNLLRLSELDNIDKHQELLTLRPQATVSVRRHGQPLQQRTTKLNKHVMVIPAELGDGSYLCAYFITFANAVGDQRNDAFGDLLDLRESVSTVVREAQTEFFAPNDPQPRLSRA